MKMPAAIARRLRMIPMPPSGTNADKPVKISQMANNKNPIFLVNLIISYLIKTVCYCYPVCSFE
jgi:hypothetical protein